MDRLRALGGHLASPKAACILQLLLALLSNIGGNYNYNAVAFAVMLVAVSKKPDSGPIFAALWLVMLTILLDLVELGVYGPARVQVTGPYASTIQFCLAMAILGLVLKPWTCFVCYREYKSRRGDGKYLT